MSKSSTAATLTATTNTTGTLENRQAARELVEVPVDPDLVLRFVTGHLRGFERQFCGSQDRLE